MIAPLALFVCFYVATLLLLSWSGFPFPHWTGLVSATVATIAAVGIVEHGRWRLGLFVPPITAARDLVAGGAAGFLLVGGCGALIVLTSTLTHVRGGGIPWRELALVYVPAAVHEEIVFRGYPFQKLLQWNRSAAVLLVALAFAALHAGNASVTFLGLTNVFLGGVLLGVAFERVGRLWFPIGLHLAWNAMAGPVLGHEVSGYVPAVSVLAEIDRGPRWLTGGEFGIEGSVWMTVAEIAGILALRRRARG